MDRHPASPRSRPRKQTHPDVDPAASPATVAEGGSPPTALNRSLGRVNVAVARKPKPSRAAEQVPDKVAAGRRNWAAFQTRLRADAAPDRDSAATYTERYDAEPKDDRDLPSNVQDHLRTLGIRLRGFTEIATAPKGGKLAYDNFYDATQGVIVASWNYAKNDPGEHRPPFSEVLFHEYSAQARRTGSDVGNLRYVVRSSIQGEDAIAVLQAITPLAKRQPGAANVWLPGSDEFDALLATDNVKSIPFLLSDHRAAFGGKSIVRIVTLGLSAIVIELG